MRICGPAIGKIAGILPLKAATVLMFRGTAIDRKLGNTEVKVLPMCASFHLREVECQMGTTCMSPRDTSNKVASQLT